MQELAKVDKVLQQPSKEKVLSPTIELNKIAQESVAQLEEVSSTLSDIYHISTEEMEHAFKDSAGVRTDWASHVILLNSKLPLGEHYWYMTQVVQEWVEPQYFTNADRLKSVFSPNHSRKISNFSARLTQLQINLFRYVTSQNVA